MTSNPFAGHPVVNAGSPESRATGGGTEYNVRRISSTTIPSPAIVYCEANFGELDGKTANGLVRHSEKYDVVAIIDSTKAGLDAGFVLDGEPNAFQFFDI